MRRPLCLICAAFVVSVFISLKVTPLSENACTAEEGSCVSYVGEVYHKEYRYDNLLLYLRNVDSVNSTNIPTNFTFSVEEKEQNMGVLCYIKEGEEPRLGSLICVSGECCYFNKARNPGGFDQERYYQIQKIGFSMKNVRILAESEGYSKYQEGLYQLRRRMEHIFEQTMSKKDASIMKAMILGNKTELDKDSKELYQKSGISHILAISGLHISLIGMGLYKLLRKVRVPMLLAAGSAVCMMIMYGDMVGMSSSAYRAIFMFALKMGAEVLHRTYDMLTALAMAAVGILLEQPLYLYHAGFLLSFGAIIGIGCILEVMKTDTKQIYLNKKRQKRSEWIRNLCLSKIKDSLLGSMSIFLIHFPIMLSFYYEFPVYSFLLNLLVIPAMSLVMALGLGCLLSGALGLGVVGAGISQVTATGCHILLVLFEKLCQGAMTLPGACWITGEPDNWRVIVFYGVVFLLFLLHKYIKYEEKGKLCLTFPIKMMWVLAAVIILTQKTYGGLEITMLDVGQGDGIWLETQTGHHYLIDGGSTSEDKLCEYTLVPFLKQTGTAVLDAVFLTHLDADHISGVLELLKGEEGIQIRKVVLAKAAIRDEVYAQLVQLCKEQGIPLVQVQSGDIMTDGALSIEVLHPSADYVTDSRNAYSLVMKLEYGDFHALFTGDVEADGESAAAEALPENWECHLYKVAHHGSRNSNTLSLLEQIHPRLAMISCEEGNSYGHPHIQTLERLEKVGSKVMATKDYGAVTVKVGQRIEVCGWLTSE